MQSYFIKEKTFYDSDNQPSQPYSYSYGDRPVFEFSFLPNEIVESDLLVFAIDNDMIFYDSTPENLLHSASCMVVVKHDVTAEEATQGKVQLRVETRTVKFRDAVNGRVRPVEVISGLYVKRGSDDDINYSLLAKGRAFANGIIADYDSLPEPITVADEFYSKTEIDNKLEDKADENDLVAHTGDSTIHVTQQEKTEWSNKADLNAIGSATVTITQGGVNKGAFSVNATSDVTINLNDGGVQADWNEADSSSPAYIQHKPSIYTKTETDNLLNAKADETDLTAHTNNTAIHVTQQEKTAWSNKADRNDIPTAVSELTNDSDYQSGEQVSASISVAIENKADKATTLSGYGITDAYTKNELATVATTGKYDDLTNKPDLTAKLDAPATAGNAGQVLTKTADGQEWADAQSYTLPIATDATLGGIKVGSGLSIDSNGVLSADAQSSSYKLPVASASTLGGVKVDNSAGALKVAQDGLLALQVKQAEALTSDASGLGMSLHVGGGLLFQTDTYGNPAKSLGISPKATYLQIPGASGSLALTPTVQPWKLTVSGALTLSVFSDIGINDTTLSNNDIAYAEVVIVLGESGSVTAGPHLTLVDALTAGKTNYCVIRWESVEAKLFVWRVE